MHSLSACLFQTLLKAVRLIKVRGTIVARRNLPDRLLQRFKSLADRPTKFIFLRYAECPFVYIVNEGPCCPMALLDVGPGNTCITLHRPKLTLLQHRRNPRLPSLMEEEEWTPPPVPPKYLADEPTMEIDQPSSKRKRDGRDYTYGDHDFSNQHNHPAKRSRSHGVGSDEDATPLQYRSIRHKKGVRNLSNLNLRHAAAQQRAPNSPRGSKFQEGSLTDRPSSKPPSVFLHFTKSGDHNPQAVERHMSDYYEALATPPESRDVIVREQEETPASQLSGGMKEEAAKKQESTGFFRSLANFYPIALWNKIWNEQKEQLRRENMLEAERKARIKQEAEAKYAEMKGAGEFTFKSGRDMREPGNVSTGHHSAVRLEASHLSPSEDQLTTPSYQFVSPQDENLIHDETENLDTASKPLRGRKSRFQLKRPSLSNIKQDLKRVRSDFNLNGSTARESSTSQSPSKIDIDHLTLKKSHSKYDLKRQHKLSKRVSDLEIKLQQARRELDEALIEASPMPKLGNRYERFNSSTLFKGSKFGRSRLPTLHSEQVLLSEPMDLDHTSGDLVQNGETEAELTKALYSAEGVYGHKVINTKSTRETPGLSRAEEYSEEASTQVGNRPIENTTHTNQTTEDSDYISNMDPNSITNLSSDEANTSSPAADYETLDAKLKALDQAYKASKKHKTPKKRKSDAHDTTFKPGTNANDDDDEWDEVPKKKKQRKSTAKQQNGAQNKRKPVIGNDMSPNRINGNKPKGTSKSHSNAAGKDKKDVMNGPVDEMNLDTGESDASDDELAGHATLRSSVESPVQPLEPVYEEEEEITSVPVNDEPSKPTAKATPARYGHRVERARASSPQKLSGNDKVASGAAGATLNDGQGRSISPPPNKHTEVAKVINDTVTVIPGKGEVPELPKGANGSFESLDQLQRSHTKAEILRANGTGKEEFEWPEDVF